MSARFIYDDNETLRNGLPVLLTAIGGEIHAKD